MEETWSDCPVGFRVGGEWWITNSFHWWQTLPLWSLFTFVGFSVSISQLHLWWSIWEEKSVPFMTNVPCFWQEQKTVFFGDLLQLHASGVVTKVWTCHLHFLDIKPSRRGRQEKKSPQRVVWCFEEFVAILITPSMFCSSTESPLHGWAAHVAAQGKISEEPCALFNALLSPSWNS